MCLFLGLTKQMPPSQAQMLRMGGVLVVGDKSTVGCRFPDVLSWRAACTLWARGIHLGGGASPSAGGVWRKVEMMCGDTARRGSSGWRWRWRPRCRWRWVADPFCSGDFFVSFE